MIFFLRSYISLNNRRVCHWYSYALHCISHRRRIEKRGGRCREVFVCGKCVELQIARRRRRHSSRERSTSRSLTFLTRVKFTYESILNPFRTPIGFTDESVTVRRSMYESALAAGSRVEARATQITCPGCAIIP